MYSTAVYTDSYVQGSHTFVKTKFKAFSRTFIATNTVSQGPKNAKPSLQKPKFIVRILINADKHDQIIDSYQAVWFWTRGATLP